jgi:superfamily I DNA and/or RNA helicase
VFLLCLQITTVDKYQGQQNDFVLLSLVRTRIVGHLRDVRRLVVALSRSVSVCRSLLLQLEWCERTVIPTLCCAAL